MEFEPSLMLNSKKKILNDKDLKLDSTYVNSRFSKSAATTDHSANVEDSPYTDKRSGRLKFEKNSERITLPKIRKNALKLKTSKMQNLIKKRFRKSLN